MECKYCHNKFTTKSSLNKHVKYAKYCISKRNIGISTSFECHGCTKKYTSKYALNIHTESCTNIIIQNYEGKLKELTEQLQNQKEKYEKRIDVLQDKLENIAIKAVSRPTTRNTQINNYIQQLKHVTDEHLIDSVSNLTIDHIIKGPEGYAEYALEYPLKDRMLCSDYSRRKVKFKDKDGKVVTDPEMNTLALKFFESIKDKNRELIRRYANEAKEKLGDDNVMDTVVKLFDYKSAVEKGSDGGDKSEFHHDFVRQMCSQTIKE
jgi:predicted transcriptional regulator